MKFGFSSNGCRCLYNYFFLPGFRRISTSSSKEGNTSSSFANFLVDKLGFSNHQSLSTSATLASRRGIGGAIKWVEKAESVIQFLKQIGFQQSDIRKIVSDEPRILLSKVSQTLKPKIKLLNDLGLSGSDLVQVVVRNPLVLRRNLGPAIHAFRTVLSSDENVARVMKRWYGVMNRWYRVEFYDAANYLIPNVELLQSYCGISGDKLQKRIIHDPKTYCVKTSSFKNFLIRVEEKLGIPRNSGMFVYGIECVAVFSDKNVYDKCQIFKSFGWTQSDVMELIRRNPLCLTANEERIKDRLDFLINQLGYKPDHLASHPSFFIYSIEKRLLPRHRVLEALKEKGLIKEHYLLSSASVFTEANFLKKFILPFEEIHEVYAQLTGSTVKSLVAGRAKGQI
uniref:Uncharacterized protein n=1 Tax=Chenopodium quinoa TaxID=63459 RepID=A0A803L3H1_CHEQI